METERETDTLSFEMLPDIGTGTVAVARGASTTVVDPTTVVSPDIAERFKVVVVGWRLRLVTDM